jgi:hypothetical protein
MSEGVCRSAVDVVVNFHVLNIRKPLAYCNKNLQLFFGQ